MSGDPFKLISLGSGDSNMHYQASFYALNYVWGFFYYAIEMLAVILETKLFYNTRSVTSISMCNSLLELHHS